MKQLLTIVFALLLALSAGLSATAQSQADAAEATEAAQEEADVVIEEDAITDDIVVEGLLIYDAAEVNLDEFLWLKRPIVIFAGTPADPAFARQVEYLQDVAEQMLDRDVVLVVDTDPSANSEARQRLRPRGFMLAIIGKDGEVKWRRPTPRSGREVVQTIDKFPLRREEMLDQLPSGRG